MSLALLKNLVFRAQPVQAQSEKPPFQEQPNKSSDIQSMSVQISEEDIQSMSVQVSSDCSIDLEAQDPTYHCDHCRLREEEPQPKRKWFRKFTITARVISDAIIGLADGLTVPFALTAGLSSLGDTRLVVLGGLAELFAGAISMGLGGFTGAKSEAHSYEATARSTQELIKTSPAQISCLLHKIFKPFGLSASDISRISKNLHESPENLVDCLMSFHHEMPKPKSSRPLTSAITIALGYFLGGFVPLIPYFCVKREEVLLALWWSIGTMVIALFAFGWIKTGVVSGWRGKRNILTCTQGALQMVLLGGICAGVAVGLVRLINLGYHH